jgi:hypothetical protein
MNQLALLARWAALRPADYADFVTRMQSCQLQRQAQAELLLTAVEAALAEGWDCQLKPAASGCHALIGLGYCQDADVALAALTALIQNLDRNPIKQINVQN